jgi:hypothetical protein
MWASASTTLIATVINVPTISADFNSSKSSSGV